MGTGRTSSGVSLSMSEAEAPSSSTKMLLAYAPVTACIPSNFIEKSERVSSDLIRPKSNTCGEVAHRPNTNSAGLIPSHLCETVRTKHVLITV